MLFSSQPFLLIFLPLALVFYYGFAAHRTVRLGVILVMSLVFYAWWDVRFVPLLITMIGLTWLVVELHARVAKPWLLLLGVAMNLSVLALFKYANFFAESVLTLAGVEHQPWNIVLPLGISFFTFQQVSYLVDCYRGQAPRYGLLDYAAYVSFFPQLIAGPIVRHNQLIPQFDTHPVRDGSAELAARGAVLLVLGLIKKVFFADELAPIADTGFNAVHAGAGIAPTDAWLAAITYSLQLYFDFSAYSDMAIGLGAMFGFALPLNFDAPYRATDIRVFWRRWHITLSNFLRDYVYIPLGGSRGTLPATLVVVMTTMLLCGLWHGAGWTFVAWGAAHGAAICANRLWVAVGVALPGPVGWLITMIFVVFGWVLFRAESFSDAAVISSAMAGSGAGRPIFDSNDVFFASIGVLFALAGPTNFQLTQARSLIRYRYAIATAVGMVLVALRVGQGRGLEFIYFQF